MESNINPRDLSIEEIQALDNETMALMLNDIEYDRLGYISSEDMFVVALNPKELHDKFTMFVQVGPEVVKEFMIRQIHETKCDDYDLDI